MTVDDGISSRGLVYAADYSANFTDRSLIDKEYVDSTFIGRSGYTDGTGSFEISPTDDEDMTVRFGNSNQRISDVTFEITELNVLCEGDGNPTGDLRFNDTEFYVQQYQANPGDRDGYSIEMTNSTMEMGFRQNFGLISNPIAAGFAFTESQMQVVDTVNTTGLLYAADYSANFVDRSLVDKAYVDSVSSDLLPLDNTWTGRNDFDNILTVGDGTNEKLFVTTANNVTIEDANSGTTGFRIRNTANEAVEMNFGNANADAGFSINYAGSGGSDIQIFNEGTVALGKGSVLVVNPDSSLTTINSTVNIGGLYTLPVADGTAGQVMKTDGAGVVTFQDEATVDTIYTADSSWTGTRSIEANTNGILQVNAYDTTVADYNNRGNLTIGPSFSGFAYFNGDGAGGNTGLSQIILNSTSMTVDDNISSRGLVYAADYSANFTDRSIVDKAYADSIPTFLNTASSTIDGESRIIQFTNDGSVSFDVYDAGTSGFSNRGTFSLNSDGSFWYYRNGSNQRVGFEVDASDFLIRDEVNSKGMEYQADYSANFTDRSIVDKGYVDNAVSGTPTLYTADGNWSGTSRRVENVNDATLLISFLDGADLASSSNQFSWSMGAGVNTQAWISSSSGTLKDQETNLFGTGTGIQILSNGPDASGLGYFFDVSSTQTYGDRWIPDKGYVDKKSTHLKSMTIRNPTGTEDLTMFYTSQAITVTQVTAVIVGAGTSIVVNPRHTQDRSGGTTAIIQESGLTTNSKTTGNIVNSGFNDETIPANSFITLILSSLVGVIDEVSVTVEYTVD